MITRVYRTVASHRWLVAVVMLSVLLRGIAAALRKTPAMFPDEYIYSAISRGFADGGLPTIRGHIAHFPAILYPLLTAPAWLFSNVATAYRVSQGIGVVAMSLAAVPAYALARSLGVSKRTSLAVAAVTVACPDMLYSDWMMAETFAYPLAIAAVYAAVRTIETPTWRRQLATFGLFTLLALTRIQFIAMFPVYLLAAAIVLVRSRDRSFAKAHIPMIAATLLFGAVVSLLGVSSTAGYYAAAFHNYPVITTLTWFGRDALALLYASGWALIPGALLGIVFLLGRPASRRELGFAAFTVPFALALFTESAAYSVAGRVQERYMFYLVPLLAISCARYFDRGAPARIVHALLALALLVPSAVDRLANTVFAYEKDGSPMLLAGSWATDTLGLATPDMIFLIACVLALLLALVPMIKPGALRPTVFACATTLAVLIAFGAAAFDTQNSGNAAPNEDWVDMAHIGNVDLVSTSMNNRLSQSTTLFWNRSIKNVLTTPGGGFPDAFGGEPTTFSKTGVMLAAGHPVHAAVLVDENFTSLLLNDGRQIGPDRFGFLFWKPRKTVRATAMVQGRDRTGGLGTNGALVVWNKTPMAGRIVLQLGGYSSATRSATIMVQPRDGTARKKAKLPPGATKTLSFPVCGTTYWRAQYEAEAPKNDPFHGAVVVSGTELITAAATMPRYVPDPSACRAQGTRG